ncbi:unnamed protein product, partial [Rotaria sp. Silwood1]
MRSRNSIKGHRPAWFIFYYLKYCGFGKKYVPGWEAAGRYAISWSKYIQIGAYDCASETTLQSKICKNEEYPQWHIFCPLRNSTQFAFDPTLQTYNTSIEEIFIWTLKTMNKIAHECYGKSWPIRDVL